MDWTRKLDVVIAILSALGFSEGIRWLIRRYRNRGEISAEAGRIRAETKSLEVKTLSGLVVR